MVASTILYRCLGFLIVLVSWFIATAIFPFADPNLLPSPMSVGESLATNILSGQIKTNLTSTLFRWIPGLLYGSLTGITLGLVLGLLPNLANIIRGPMEFLRAIPVTALIPLIFLIFNTGDQSKVFMCFLPSFLLLVVYSESAVKRISKNRLEIFEIMGATKKQVFFKLILWETLPTTLLGLRLAFSTSLLVAIVSEMFIGANSGIGQRIYESYMYNNTIELYSMIFVVGILGYSGSSILEKLENISNQRILGC